MTDATERKKDPMAQLPDIDLSNLSDSAFEQQKHVIFRAVRANQKRRQVEHEARKILDAEAAEATDGTDK